MATALFLQKTFEMLNLSHPEVAAWTPDGRAFTVYDLKTFESTMLVRFFRHGHFSSFARQLRFYGFTKCRRHQHVEKEPALEFMHPHFQRDDPMLMMCITRNTNPAMKASNNATNNDVHELQQRVETLGNHINALTTQLDLLTNLLAARGMAPPTAHNPAEDTTTTALSDGLQ
ncbi:hypothetical protein SPRG_16586 [Saprolegnia parasitica CBS 223.65]|uniref:HSF-type DNA-binding domain-containing protein n=1 Tax=Saprolegnia parasitica (strain CBS 223.65) TaxID=695850 RepID=A0A067BUR5_SAPPC|nr:hypothetical protein SPRG_16586 [Saprolegnia parasitica CBS 223.65]KDO18031.1 hypothetical protein SPRG_16586 [Saprolegnia parasitica CBS 223.65]|eukprot:XP_012211261.1 hypothetical protein SPRG_16586 [Saprolegnia parasitica CBS 223.65]